MTEINKLEIGIKGHEEKIVAENETANNMGNNGVNVFSSPAMIGFMEVTCRHSVAKFLNEGETTVGIAFDIKHRASANVGTKVKCDTKLIEIHNKRLVFSVKCYDDEKVIGDGIHQRYIVNTSRYKD